MITTRTIYSYRGMDFNSARQAMEAVEDDIGRVIDENLKNVTPAFSAGQLLAIHAMLLNNRKKLVQLLSIEIPEED